MLNILTLSEEWYADGTFSICPRGYYQVFIIIGYNNFTKNYTPGAYILLTNKTSQIYKSAFNLLKIIGSFWGCTFHPKRFLCDYEQAIMKSFKEEFPGVDVESIIDLFIL